MARWSAERVFAVRCIANFDLLALLFAMIKLLLRTLLADGNPVGSIDHTVLQDLHKYSGDHPLFSTFMRSFSDAGAVIWWIILTPICVRLMWHRRSRLAVFIAVTTLGGSLLNRVIKVVIGRARPYFDDPIATATGNSFPSGHAQAAAVGSAVLVILVSAAASTRVRGTPGAATVAPTDPRLPLPK